jgi:hypothetical protein
MEKIVYGDLKIRVLSLIILGDSTKKIVLF